MAGINHFLRLILIVTCAIALGMNAQDSIPQATGDRVVAPAHGTRSVAKRPRVSQFWTRQFHTWHWMSSAIALVGMLLFAATGITLNHASDIESQPSTTTREAQMPPALARQLPADPAADAAVPPAIVDWLADNMRIDVRGHDPEWDSDGLYVAMPRPGGNAWVSVGRDGTVVHEITSRGWIAYLNDLHKGRHTGAAWAWFLDIFSAACIIFCLTGLLLLQLHARKRALTWPLVGAGLLAPVLLLMLFVH